MQDGRRNEGMGGCLARRDACGKRVVPFCRITLTFLLWLGLTLGLLGAPRLAFAETAARALQTWESLLEPGSSASFDTYARFLLAHPDWPKTGALRDEAEKRADSASPLTLQYFSRYPPRTFAGVQAYVAALGGGRGLSAAESDVLRTVWLTELPSVSDQRAFLQQYRSVLRSGDVARRVSALIWQDRGTQARDLLAELPPDTRALMEARLALRAGAGQASALVARLPPSVMQDPGLTFDRARWRIRNDDEAGGAALLRGKTFAVEADTASSWWRVRENLARWALEQGDSAEAYALARLHGFSKTDDPVSYTEAEWLAGWIALRFRGDPASALAHFSRMREAAVSVISKARGDYWIGRATAASGQAEKARRWYQSAAAYGTTFYGQVAAIDGYGDVRISAPHPHAASDAERRRFETRDLVQAVTAAHATGDRDLTSRFFRALVETITTQDDATLIANLALKLGRRDLAVWTAKNAGRKGFIVGREGYPTLGHPPGNLPAVLSHAIIRQESGFDPQARSPAGALGMMQLMPDTAQRVARQMGLTTGGAKLTADPQHNIQLGSTLFSDLMDKYGDSVVLAAVGYNAGPARVGQWRDRFGDPRETSPPVRQRLAKHTTGEPRHWLALDVIESYPFSETRFYIQQILANMEVYRAVLDTSGGARLSLLSTLTGG